MRNRLPPIPMAVAHLSYPQRAPSPDGHQTFLVRVG
jgi:hypothetical protein